MVVGMLGTNFPFVDRPASSLCRHLIFSRQMFGQQAMLGRFVAEQRQTAGITDSDDEQSLMEFDSNGTIRLKS